MPRNLVNLKDAGKGYASRTVLRDVTLGVSSGERIGVVGRNGDGKSTLLRLVAGEEEPDAGAVTRERGLAVALLGQGDELDPARLVRDSLAGDWTRDARPREVVSGLLGGVALDAPVSALSGGERRRVALAGLLLDPPELLLLDEPTNHLDVEGVDWLARHLAARRGALMVVTHDRWFLDAVCTSTWEVADGAVHQYDGGYAAYVLARAERERVEAVREERRQGLLRKELAWLQRGPPAQTSKPRFRIEAANALIEGEPEPRDRAELLRFAAARLGDRVLDAEDVSVAFEGSGAASEPGPTGRSGEASRVAPPSGATGRSGEASRVAPPSGATGRSGEAGGSAPRTILRRVTWRLGPGDRVAVVGVNGSGKTTLVRLLAGSLEPDSGTVERGATVRLAFLSQDTAAIAGHLNVLESLEDVKGVARLSTGAEITAGMLCDRFGFRGAKARTLVRDLSGGERRRLQLMRLLMGEPNVLILDEPTNDLDIDTLTALEDLLDGWPGTLVVVSHDRYFVERVCDDVYALTGDGGLRHLPGGIEQYLAARRDLEPPPPPPRRERAAPAGAVVRAARKEVARLERALERSGEREAALHSEMAAAATDHVRLRELQAALDALAAEREELEAAWLETSEVLEGA